MRKRPNVVDHDRRRLLATTAIAIAAIVAGAVLATNALAQSAGAAPRPVAAAQAVTPADQIEHHVARIDGVRFHYMTAGSGDPVLLLPGWPESWIAWRKVVPLLVGAGRRVIVLDPRGFGE